jgi:hypothetical protein
MVIIWSHYVGSVSNISSDFRKARRRPMIKHCIYGGSVAALKSLIVSYVARCNARAYFLVLLNDLWALVAMRARPATLVVSSKSHCVAWYFKLFFADMWDPYEKNYQGQTCQKNYTRGLLQILQCHMSHLDWSKPFCDVAWLVLVKKTLIDRFMTTCALKIQV